MCAVRHINSVIVDLVWIYFFVMPFVCVASMYNKIYSIKFFGGFGVVVLLCCTCKSGARSGFYWVFQNGVQWNQRHIPGFLECKCCSLLFSAFMFPLSLHSSLFFFVSLSGCVAGITRLMMTVFVVLFCIGLMSLDPTLMILYGSVGAVGDYSSFCRTSIFW